MSCEDYIKWRNHLMTDLPVWPCMAVASLNHSVPTRGPRAVSLAAVDLVPYDHHVPCDSLCAGRIMHVTFSAYFLSQCIMCEHNNTQIYHTHACTQQHNITHTHTTHLHKHTMLVHLHTRAYTRTVTGLITFFVPCYTAGKNAEMVGESCIIHCLLSFVPILNVWCHANVRGKVRDQKKIDVSA